MPVSGTTSCGAYHGCGRTTSSVTSAIMSSIVMTRLSSTGPASPFGMPLARDSVICTAASSITAISANTSHTLFALITKPMMKPIAHSCSSARHADHISVLPTPRCISSLMAAATATIASATSRPQTSIE